MVREDHEMEGGGGGDKKERNRRTDGADERRLSLPLPPLSRAASRGAGKWWLEVMVQIKERKDWKRKVHSVRRSLHPPAHDDRPPPAPSSTEMAAFSRMVLPSL